MFRYHSIVYKGLCWLKHIFVLNVSVQDREEGEILCLIDHFWKKIVRNMFRNVMA